MESQETITGETELQEIYDQLRNTVYGKWANGKSKLTNTYNASLIDTKLLNASNSDTLAEINVKHPLTSDIDLSSSAHSILLNDPTEALQCANKQYVDAISVSSGSIKNRIISLPDIKGQILVEDNVAKITLSDVEELTINSVIEDQTVSTGIIAIDQLSLQSPNLLELKVNTNSFTLRDADIESSTLISYLYQEVALLPNQLTTLKEVEDIITEETKDFVTQSELIPYIDAVELENRLSTFTVDKIITSTKNMEAEISDEFGFSIHNNIPGLATDIISINRPIDNAVRTIIYSDFDLRLQAENEVSLTTDKDRLIVTDKVLIAGMILNLENTPITQANQFTDKEYIDYFTFSKQTIDSKIAPLALKSDVYDRITMDESLALKQDKIETVLNYYNKNQIDAEALLYETRADALLNAIATSNQFDTEETERLLGDSIRYTKDESDLRFITAITLDDYSRKDLTYSKIQSDLLFPVKADLIPLATKNAVLLTTNNLQGQIDGEQIIIDTKMNIADTYTRAESDLLFPTVTAVNAKNDAEDILIASKESTGISYTKTEDDAKFRTLLNHDSMIVSTDGVSKIESRTGTNGHQITVNNNIIGSIMMQPGQTGITPLQISSTDRLVLIAGNGVNSLGTAETSNSVFLSSNDNSAVNCEDQIVIGSGTNREQLTLSTGHANIGAGEEPYSIICNSNPSTTIPNLQITPGTNAIEDSSLIMYGNAAATLFPLENQFSKKTGYSVTTAITEPNQFISKAYADATYSGGTTANSYIANLTSNIVVSIADNALEGVYIENREAAIYGDMLLQLNSEYGDVSELEISALNEPKMDISVSNGISLICQRNNNHQEKLSLRAAESTTDCCLDLYADEYNTGTSILANREMGTTAAQNGVLLDTAFLTKGKINLDYLKKTDATTTYVSRLENQINAFRMGSSLATRPSVDETKYYITGDDLLTENGVYISNTNLGMEESLAMPSGKFFRETTDAILDNDLVRYGWIKNLNLNYFGAKTLTEDLDLRSANYGTLCNTPVSLLQIANKQYVDSAISNFSLGTYIHVYRVSLIDSTGWSTSLVSGTELLCNKISGDLNIWLQPSVIMARGTENIALEFTVPNGFLLSQFTIEPSLRCAISTDQGSNGYNALYAARITQWLIVPSTISPGRSFSLQAFLDAGVSSELLYLDIQLEKI